MYKMLPMNILVSHILLIRPLNVLISGFSIFIASEIIGSTDKNLFFLVSFIVMLFASGANVLNDVLDYKIDLINAPYRPIPSGNVRKPIAFFISFLLFTLGSLLCLKLNKSAELIGLFIAMPMMILYTTFLKKLPLIGNIAVAFILGLSFLFCGVAFNSVSSMIIPMILCFSLSFLRELIKDIADIEGDLSAGLNTFPIYSGLENSIKLVVVLCFFIGVGFFIPFVIGFYNTWYIFFLIVGVEIPLGFIVVLMVKNPGVRSAKNSAKLLKFSTLMGLIAIYTGTIL